MGRFRFRGRARKTREPRPDRIPIRAIFPNLITSLAACAGITSIAMASEGRFEHALYALLVACVCDGMDGRVARLLKASSKLGAELDSLADFVNFGVAPAMFMFFWLTGKWVGNTAPFADHLTVRLVLGCSLFYAMCDCFRLARFNTMLEADPIPYWKHFFTGVPAPGGCWMVLTPAILTLPLTGVESMAGFVEFMHSPYLGMAVLLFVGSLMASRLPTISLKALHISRKAMLPTMACLLLLIGMLVTNLWLTLGVIGFFYVLTVPLTGLVFLKVRAAYEKGLTSTATKG